MELLMTREPTFCHCFFNKLTKKLMANMMFETSSSELNSTLPIATARQSTFFSWNLIVDRTSVNLPARSSAWDSGAGNFPAFERPGPSSRGICFIRTSEAMKASYFLASF